MKNPLGEQLRKFRQRKFPDLGLRKAAEKIGMSFSHLNKLERGLPPSDKTIYKLMNVYELNDNERLELLKIAGIAHKDKSVVEYFEQNPQKLKAIFYRKSKTKKNDTKP